MSFVYAKFGLAKLFIVLERSRDSYEPLPWFLAAYVAPTLDIKVAYLLELLRWAGALSAPDVGYWFLTRRLCLDQ